jgi:hypothetical protein
MLFADKLKRMNNNPPPKGPCGSAAGGMLCCLLLLPGTAGLRADFPIPASDEIALISNEPQGFEQSDFECLVPVDHGRIKDFFSEGTKVYTLDPAIDYFVDAHGQAVRYANG